MQSSWGQVINTELPLGKTKTPSLATSRIWGRIIVLERIRRLIPSKIWDFLKCGYFIPDRFHWELIITINFKTDKLRKFHRKYYIWIALHLLHYYLVCNFTPTIYLREILFRKTIGDHLFYCWIITKNFDWCNRSWTEISAWINYCIHFLYDM